MVASSLKLPRQNLLDAANLHGYVCGGKASDLSDRCGVGVFEVEEDDLPVERFKPLNQRSQALQIPAFIEGLCLIFAGEALKLFHIHET